MTKKEKIQLLAPYLRSLFPNDRIELDYETPFQLLVAVILSAQTTDKQVNKATPALFERLKEPKDTEIVGLEFITKSVSSIGFYKNKAKYIYQTWILLETQYAWKIPEDLTELQKLPWVGIKTAKVILSHLFGQPYLAVDTHVHRVCNRLGLVHTKFPEATDKKLEALFSTEDKRSIHHLLVLFWRYHCKALKPLCSTCKMQGICEYYGKRGK